jgi:cytochrome P450
MTTYPIPSATAVSAFLSSLPTELRQDALSPLPERLDLAAQELATQLNVPLEYVRHVILPTLATITYPGARLDLPMLDTVNLDKQNALPYSLWGLLYTDWKPELEFGTTVFLTGYDNRGDDNLRKRIYASALTRDLYPKYEAKVDEYFDFLLRREHEDKPLMNLYLTSYLNLYWDLHLDLKPDDVPHFAREIGTAFNTVLAYGVFPFQELVARNYMKVRELRPELIGWLDLEIKKIEQTPGLGSDNMIVHYWLANRENPDNFPDKNVSFECFHNFVAFSQWGNTIYNIISLLSGDNTHSEVVQKWFQWAKKDPDQRDGSAFTRLDRFVMELFRTIAPNGGSISTLDPLLDRPLGKHSHSYAITSHKTTECAPDQWEDRMIFDPQRYLHAPTSDQINEAKSKEIGFARCPFEKTSFKVSDGRETDLTNSAFGTVYAVTDNEPAPVCDHAGYPPFGFGYRRCPGELFTVEVIKSFLRKVWRDNIEFKLLSLPQKPEMVPVGPGAVVPDQYGFSRQ